MLHGLLLSGDMLGGLTTGRSHGILELLRHQGAVVDLIGYGCGRQGLVKPLCVEFETLALAAAIFSPLNIIAVLVCIDG